MGCFFFFQAEDGIRDVAVTGVQTCALPIYPSLTAVLTPRVHRVIVIEKDRRLAAKLGTRNAERGTDRLRVVEGNALRLDWHSLLEADPPVPRSPFRVPHFKVIGNIPSPITSPLLEKALTPPLPGRVVV